MTSERTKKVLYVDMDNVLVDFRSAFPRLPAAMLEKFGENVDDVPGIFSLMDPMPRAVESFAELADLFETFVLSTSPWENPSAWSDKLLWVKRHLGERAHKRLILSHRKDLNRGDFLVDDRTKCGADKFGGELILFGSDRFPDWPSVVSYLRERAS